MEDLTTRTFVGTESRFMSIFSLLEEIVLNSTESAESQIKQIEAQRDALQKRIDHITETGQAVRYTPTQLRDRFLLVNDIASQLQRDFAAVDQNFRQFATNVREWQSRPCARKGHGVVTGLEPV